MTRRDAASFPIRAVLFDLDGTLVDSVADIAASLNRALALCGFPEHGLGAYRAGLGDGLASLVKRLLPAGGDGRTGDVVSLHRAYYAEHFADRSAPYPGIAELLDGLEERGCPYAVLSNKREEAVRAMVDALFPTRPFAAIVGERQGRRNKPSPEGALEIAGRLGVPATCCALVGDTEIDLLTATAAGMVPIGAGWGFRTPGELARAGARALVTHPFDLLGLLDLSGGPPD